MKKTLLFFLFSLILFSCYSFAIGIGPPRNDIDFIPNLKTDLSYIVVNNQGTPLSVEIYAKGDLSQYMTLSKTSAFLSPSSDTSFTVHIELPANISPGLHDNRIGVMESTGGQGGTVGAKAGVESFLYINAPYTGKYIIVSLKTNNTKIGTPAIMYFEIQNIGAIDVDQVLVSVDIFYPNGSKATSLLSDSSSLKAGTKAVFVLNWTPTSRGRYTISAKITYDENTKDISGEFLAGDIFVGIGNIVVNDFSPGQIARVSVELQSEWNDRLDGVWAEVRIPINSSAITGESRTISLDPYETSATDVYMDTKGLTLGSYNATAIVHFANRTNEKAFIFTVREGVRSDNLQLIIIIVAVLLVIALLGWVVWKRKKGKQKVAKSSQS